MAKRQNPNDDEPQENINNDADDTFGLPEVEYEPLKRDEPIEEPAAVEEPVYEKPYSSIEETIQNEEVQEEYVEDQRNVFDETIEDKPYRSAYSYMQEDKKPVWPTVALIVLLLIVAGGAVYYFAYYQPKQKELAALKRQEDDKRRREIEEQKAREDALAAKRAEDEKRRADSLASVPKEGSIERLTSRTGQYFVVVASAIDDDLLMDFANKLSKQGKQVRLIPPFGKTGKFYRLAIEARDSYADAQTAADGMKGGDYGDQLWVVRY